MDTGRNSIIVCNKKWFSIFFPMAWLSHVGIGLALGVFGPTQPYLAKNVSTNVDTINFIWTGRSIGFAGAAIIAAFVFKKYFTSTRGKLTYLALADFHWNIHNSNSVHLQLSSPHCNGYYLWTRAWTF